MEKCPTCGEEGFENISDLSCHHKLAHDKSLVSDQAVCKSCGDEFSYYPSNKEGVYCPSCVSNDEVEWGIGNLGFDNSNSVTVNCENCGTEKDVWKSEYERQQNFFCDHSCLSEWRSGENHHQYKGGSINYGDGWWKSRRRARRRDDYTCQRCGKNESDSERSLDVHHIKPVREFDEKEEAHNLCNLTTLCRSCHRTVESS